MSNPWIDITQPFRNTIATWPGDTPFKFELAYTKNETGSVNIGRFTTSTHTGTHADAPLHFDDDAASIDELSPDIYIGKAIVLDLCHERVVSQNVLQHVNLNGVKRVLMKLHKEVDIEKFPKHVPPLQPDIAPFLAAKGIVLLGVDCPSVDAFDSKSLVTHHALHFHGIHIVENLLLQDVVPGIYEFIGLPLRIEGADGAPVRAVIRKVDAEV
ncbi:arylformamidase [Ureibacillus sp. NPDC094379]